MVFQSCNAKSCVNMLLVCKEWTMVGNHAPDLAYHAINEMFSFVDKKGYFEEKKHLNDTHIDTNMFAQFVVRMKNDPENCLRLDLPFVVCNNIGKQKETLCFLIKCITSHVAHNPKQNTIMNYILFTYAHELKKRYKSMHNNITYKFDAYLFTHRERLKKKLASDPSPMSYSEMKLDNILDKLLNTI